jgi:regulator of RNase E activity RraA
VNTCRIHPARPAVTPDLVARLAALPTSIISDSQERSGGAPGIVPVFPSAAGTSIGGPALTVRTRPGDNMVVHQALRMLEPGQVLVVDAGGADDRAIMGEIMIRFAKAQGAAGVIVDGAVRDRDGLAEQGLPVFARSVCHLGPYKSGPGEIRGTVRLGHTTVADGDVIVGDADGVVVVAAARAAEIADLAEARARSEDDLLAQASAGTLDYDWLDEGLAVEWVTAGHEEVRS